MIVGAKNVVTKPGDHKSAGEERDENRAVLKSSGHNGKVGPVIGDFLQLRCLISYRQPA